MGCIVMWHRIVMRHRIGMRIRLYLRYDWSSISGSGICDLKSILC